MVVLSKALFAPNLDPHKLAKLMVALDVFNHRHGAGTVTVGSIGVWRQWAMRPERKTPCYTTR